MSRTYSVNLGLVAWLGSGFLVSYNTAQKPLKKRQPANSKQRCSANISSHRNTQKSLFCNVLGGLERKEQRLLRKKQPSHTLAIPVIYRDTRKKLNYVCNLKEVIKWNSRRCQFQMDFLLITHYPPNTHTHFHMCLGEKFWEPSFHCLRKYN